jgi:hypothetical protein
VKIPTPTNDLDRIHHDLLEAFANHLVELDPAVLAAAPTELLDLLGCQRWFVHGTSERAHVDRLRATQPRAGDDPTRSGLTTMT